MLAGVNVGEDLGEAAGDLAGEGGDRVAGEHEEVALADGDGGVDRGEVADEAFAAVGRGEDGFGDHVGGVAGVEPAGGADHAMDGQDARGAAGIAQGDAVAGAEGGEPLAGEAEDAVGRLGRGVGPLTRGGPEARGLAGAAERVARRLPAEDARPGRERAGAQLGAGEVHLNAAGPADLGLRLPQVGDHAGPCGLVVVGAVDAHAVHAAGEQGADEGRVVGGLGRQGDHDADGAAPGAGTEERGGVLVGAAEALVEVDRVVPVAVGPGGKPSEDAEDGFDGGEGVGFGAAEGGESEGGEAALEVAIVAAAEGEVLHEVVGAAPVERMDRFDRRGGAGVERQHLLADRLELAGEIDGLAAERVLGMRHEVTPARGGPAPAEGRRAGRGGGIPQAGEKESGDLRWRRPTRGHRRCCPYP